MGHYKSNLRDLEFNLFEVFGRREILGQRARTPRWTRTPRAASWTRSNRLATGVLADSFEDGDRHPPVFDPATTRSRCPTSFKKSYRALHATPSGRASTCPPSSAARAPRAACTGRWPSWSWAPTRPSGCTPAAPTSPRSCGRSAPPSRSASPSWPSSATGARPWCSPSRTRAPTSAPAAPRRSSSPTAPGTSRASSASSPAPSTTWPRTSSTSCWPAPRAPGPAPRACRCSSCPSTTWTWRPASWASATASTSPTSRRRWA